MTSNERSQKNTVKEFECGNCLAETTEYGDCPVCGAAPHKGEGYRIECQDCGAVEFGDRGDDAGWDKRYHRMHHCPDAEFEVSKIDE